MLISKPRGRPRSSRVWKKLTKAPPSSHSTESLPCPFCKRLGLHYTGLFNDRKSDRKCPPRKQSTSSPQVANPRPKSTENISCEPNAAEAGVTSSHRLPALTEPHLHWSPSTPSFLLIDSPGQSKIINQTSQKLEAKS
jgi:hypothetical protein